MLNIYKYRSIPKLFLSVILLQSLTIYAKPVPEDIQISPIITTQENKTEDEKKEPPAPGLSFGVPSAYGSAGGSAYASISYRSAVNQGIFTFYNDDDAKVADGSMNVGFGLGDPNQLAAEVSIGIISIACQDGYSCFGADGTAGIKLHKSYENKFINGIGVGYSDLVKWGEASDFATIYGVASKDFKIGDKNALLNLGIGTGQFRTKSDIDANENKPNLFGGVGVQLASRLSIATGWNGSTLGAGFGISPFNFPLSVSTGVTDVTDVNGQGMQFSLNLGYSINF